MAWPLIKLGSCVVDGLVLAWLGDCRDHSALSRLGNDFNCRKIKHLIRLQ